MNFDIIMDNWGAIIFVGFIVILIFQQRLREWYYEKFKKKKTTDLPAPQPSTPTDWSMTPSDTLYTASGVEEPAVQLKRQFDEAIANLERIRNESAKLREAEEKDRLECGQKAAWYKNRKDILAVQYQTYDAQAKMTSQIIERTKQ